jgi:hypothetical protein
MNIKKPLIVAGMVSGLALTTLAGANVVSAATSTGTSMDPQSSLIDKIAKKFNLNKDDVKAVFDQNRSEREADRQKNIEDKLNQAVTDKKITSEQKDKILAKLKELQTDRDANHDAMQDKTPAERKAAMDAKRAELEQWAKDNNIPTEYLRFLGGPHGHGGPGDMKPAKD